MYLWLKAQVGLYRAWWRNHSLHKSQNNSSTQNSEMHMVLDLPWHQKSCRVKAEQTDGMQATVFGLNWVNCQSEMHKLNHMAHQLIVFGLFPLLSKPLGVESCQQIEELRLLYPNVRVTQLSEEDRLKPCRP